MLDLSFYQSYQPNSYNLYQPQFSNSIKNPQLSTYPFQQANLLNSFSTPNFNSNNQIRNYEEISCILQPNGKKGGLFLGNIYSATDKKLLEKYKIGAILTVMQGARFKCGRNIEQLILPVDDFAWINIFEYFNKGTQFIQNNLKKTNVLVHCFAGISRSASLVIALLMRYRGMNLNDAYFFTKSKRPQIQPNAGFYQQLKDYEYAINEFYWKQAMKQNSQVKQNSYAKQHSLRHLLQQFFY